MSFTHNNHRSNNHVVEAFSEVISENL